MKFKEETFHLRIAQNLIYMFWNLFMMDRFHFSYDNYLRKYNVSLQIGLAHKISVVLILLRNTNIFYTIAFAKGAQCKNLE